MDTRELRELAKGIREIFGGFQRGEGICEHKVYSVEHPEWDEIVRCFGDLKQDAAELAQYIAALSPDVLEGLCDKADKSYPHMCRDEHDEIGFRNSEIELCPVCEAKNRADALRAENERLRLALKRVIENRGERDKVLIIAESALLVESTRPAPDQKGRDELAEAAREALPQFEELVNEYHGEDRVEDCVLCSVLERLRRALAGRAKR
jgi:hypothetical protein